MFQNIPRQTRVADEERLAWSLDDDFYCVRDAFNEFNNSLGWNLHVPPGVDVNARRASCWMRNGHHAKPTSYIGREHIYASSLRAICYNEDELVWKFLQAFSSDEAFELPLEVWCPGSLKDIRNITKFCSDPSCQMSDIFASLLQYAVMCGNERVVEYLLPFVEDVSALSNQCCPFLPLRFKSTPLWLAAYQQQPTIMRLLFRAGASPYEVCQVRGREGYGLHLNIFTICETHHRSRIVLQSPDVLSRRFPVPLPIVVQILTRGSDRMVEFLKASFRWHCLGGDIILAMDHLASLKQCCSFLELPCHSQEEIAHKQTICTRMLLRVIRYYSPEMSVLETDWLVATIKDLIRHGAMVCGGMTSTSTSPILHILEFSGNGMQSCWFVGKAPSCFLQLSDNSRVPQMLANCAADPELVRKISANPLALTINTVTNRPALFFRVPYFWEVLDVIRCLENPVIRQLFHCGALAHVRSLESIPFSTRDRRLHDGPTCQCEGVTLSTEQMKMSITDLLLAPNIPVPSLQASCRNLIIDRLQRHGVVPAIKELPLTQFAKSYLLYT